MNLMMVDVTDSKVSRLLDRNGQIDDAGEHPIYTYNEGWSDERVLAESKAEVNLPTIIGLRKENFGRLPTEIKPRVAKADLAGRIEVLEAINTDLIQRLAKVEKALKDLGAI